MAKSQSSRPSDTDHFSVMELRETFESLGDAEYLKLNKAAGYLGWKCGLEGDELLGEAMMRALKGNRHCRRDLPPFVFLVGIMKSLARRSSRSGKRTRSPSTWATMLFRQPGRWRRPHRTISTPRRCSSPGKNSKRSRKLPRQHGPFITPTPYPGVMTAIEYLPLTITSPILLNCRN